MSAAPTIGVPEEGLSTDPHPSLRVIDAPAGELIGGDVWGNSRTSMVSGE